MELRRKVGIVVGTAYLLGLLIAAVCWWILRPAVVRMSELHQVIFAILFMGSAGGLGMIMRAVFLLVLPVSLWENS